MSDKRMFPDRNCPTCLGTGVRNCSGSIIYDENGKVRSSSCATTPCHCMSRAPAPAVPDDVAETAKRLRQATFTKGRMRGGIGGQTIEANMRSTFHEVSAWDLDRAADALEAQAAELARLREALAGLEGACEQLASTRTHEVYLAMIDSGQAHDLLDLDARRKAARAALTHTGD